MGAENVFNMTNLTVAWNRDKFWSYSFISLGMNLFSLSTTYFRPLSVSGLCFSPKFYFFIHFLHTVFFVIFSFELIVFSFFFVAAVVLIFHFTFICIFICHHLSLFLWLLSVLSLCFPISVNIRCKYKIRKTSKSNKSINSN